MNGIEPLPANPFHVAVYLELLSQDASSPSPILTATYSIDWVHALSDYAKISVHCMVKSMMSSCQRVLAKPKCRKEPITAAILQLLAVRLKDKSSVTDLRTLALCLIGFAGFFRFNEYAPFVLVIFVFFTRIVVYS